MLTHPLKNECYLALIEKRHAEKYYKMLEKNRDYYKGILHFIDKIKDKKGTEALIMNAQKSMIEGEMVIWGLWKKGEIIGVVHVRDINEDLKSGGADVILDN